MDNKKFSVIIPAYNAEKFIENCMDSVRTQTYTHYEVIVVNDGSEDGTESVVKKYAKRYPDFKLRYIYQTNGGAATARSTGIENAVNEFIAFLDADDIWYTNKLEIVNEMINKETNKKNKLVFYHDEYEVSLNGKKRLLRCRELSNEPLDDLIINGNALSTSTVVAERKLLNKANTFRDGARAGEDIQCWIELARIGANFCHIPMALGEYRRTEGSLTIGSPEYIKATNEMLIDFYNFLSKEKYSDKEINLLKKKQMAQNMYILGRSYHITGHFGEAIKEYKNSLKNGGPNLKICAALVLAYTKIVR